MNSKVTIATTSRKHSGIRILALPELTVPARDATRGIIPIIELDNDLEVKVPKSSDLRPGDFIRLFNAGTWFGDELEITQADLDDPTLIEFTLIYPQSEFPAPGTDVTVALDYGIYDPFSENGQPSQRVVNTRFDRRAAGGAQLPPIAFTEEQLSGITEADMVADVLPLVISPYHYGEAEDKIELWLGTSADESSGTWLVPTFEVTNPTLNVRVEITRQELEDAGDGLRYFAYRVTDWAGNISGISSTTPIEVFLQLPALDAPLVPEADDGLITYNDANPSVGVAIPTYDGASAGDSIVLSWGAARLAPYVLTPADAINDPLVTLEVPYAIVRQEGDGNINVRYQMSRAGQPPITSGDTPVEVNLTTPGGPDPDPNPELPEHGNIKAPTIKCGTSPDNTITPGDFGKDAVAIITRPGVDNKPIWLVDDVIQLHWQNISNPELTPVTVTVSNEPANINYPIPFTGVIDQTGSGEFDVYFTLTRELPASPNPVPVTVRSPIQRVRVTAGAELPGDGNPLNQASFPDANSRNIITRAVGMAGTVFRIPLAGVSNIELTKNPRVSYDFVGIETPLNQVTPPPPPFTPIEASRIKMAGVALTQSDLDTGYIDVPLPYSLTYYICRNGAIVDYTIENDIGPTQASQGYVYFALNQGGGTCTLP